MKAKNELTDSTISQARALGAEAHGEGVPVVAHPDDINDYNVTLGVAFMVLVEGKGFSYYTPDQKSRLWDAWRQGWEVSHTHGCVARGINH